MNDLFIRNMIDLFSLALKIASVVETGRTAGLPPVSDMEKVYDLFFRFPSVCPFTLHHACLRG